MNETPENPTAAAVEGELDDAALEVIDGGHGKPALPDHRLTWSELLTDPNLAVHFQPDVPGDQPPARAAIVTDDDRTTVPDLPTAHW